MGFEFWLSRWKKVTAASQPIRSRGQIRKVGSRSGLGVEELESRVVPTAISWTGSAGTMNWGTAANWSTNSVPTAGDNVTISLSGIGTIDVGPGNYSVLTLDDSTAALLVETGGSLSFASASPLSILSQNITVQSGATLAFGANSSVEIGPSSTLTVDGNLNFANADTVSFTFSSGATTEISVASGGTMTATNTAFSNATPTSDTAEIVVATGGQLQSSASTYSLTEVSLNEQLATGNLTSNSFNCPLYIQAFDVPFLSGTGNNNFQFDDIYIDGTTIASGTLSLNPIGTGSTANLVWLIGGNTTIAAGATLSIGSGVDFSIADGSELDDYGTFSFGGGNTLTFGDTFDGTNQLVVESGGSLIANNTLFAAASTFANTTELTVDAGGLIHVSNSTFSITQVTLNNELTTGNLTGDIFDGPLSVLAQDVQYLSGTGNQNVQFQDVEIQAYDLPSGTYALTAIGTGSTANLVWIFAGNFAVEAGAALSIAPGLNVTIDANCEIDDYGSLAFGANDAVAFGYTGFATTQIVVEDDGTMTADDDRFTADSTDATFNTAQIVVDNGGQIQFANSIFTLTQVALNGSLSTGNLVGNTFNCPLSLPEWDVPYLSGTGNQNFEFQDIEILTGDLASGTLALDAIGTGSTANLLWILDGNFKIDGGATLAVGTDVSFAILGGMELDDYGTLTFAGGDVATFDDAFDATEQIAVEYGAILTANSTQFIQANSFANTAEISIANGGQIQATDCAFTLTEVNLDETLSAGDLTGNTFTCSLELPVPDLPFISGSANVSFDDVELLPYALTSGSTLTLNLIGSGSKANLVYVFAGDFTIDGGATLAVAPNVSLAIVGGYTVDDYGTMTLSSGDSTAFEYDIFATTELIVENGGSLTASTAQFVDSPTNDTNSELLVENDGQIQASNSTFALGEVYLNCALSVGSLTGNTFDCPLYLPGTDVQYLSGAGSSNLQFEAIEILPGTVEAGQTLAFDSIGSGSTANLVYILTGNTAIDFGAALAIGADVNVELDPNVTLADSGDLTFGGGDTLSFASGPGDTTQIDVANGGVAIAAGVDFANSTPTWNNEFITVASGGQLQASNDSFNVTSLTLASGSSGTVLYDTFSSQLEVDSNSTFAIQYDDFTDVPSNPANDGIIATGNPNATINLTDNYWGTTVASQIAAKILDHTLDPTTRPTIAFSPALGQKVSQTFGSSASTAYSTSAQTLSLSASITSPSGIIDEGTATFTLLSGSTTIGSPVTVNVSNGSAVAPYVIPAGSAVGTYTIQVSYNGTANYSASSDSTQTLTIAAAATSTAATNAGATYSSGSQSVGLRATVASSAGIVDAGPLPSRF